MTIPPMTKAISALACLISLYLGGVAVYKGGLRGCIIIMFVGFHCFLMVKNRWDRALRIAGWELIAFTAILLEYFYPILEAPYVMPPIKFEYARIIWLISVAVLFLLARICFKTADKLKSRKPI